MQPNDGALPSCTTCLASHRFRPRSTSASDVTDLGTAPNVWAATPYNLQVVNVSGTTGLPSWAGPYAWSLTGQNYIDLGTQTFGGTFSIVTLVRKSATPVGNNPVFDLASTSDGVQLFYQPSGLGPVFAYYDGRTYQSYISDTASVANSVWQHNVLVFQDVASNAGTCSAAGASNGRVSCTVVSAYKNGALVTQSGQDFVGGFSGRNPVVKGLVGGQYDSLPKTSRSGLYIGKSNWPQSGFNGYVADWALIQDQALSAQNVSDLYAGTLRLC